MKPQYKGHDDILIDYFKNISTETISSQNCGKISFVVILHSHFFYIMFSRFRITKNTCWILEDHFVVQGQCSFFFNLELISFLINS
jgi:hypothetical protein